MREFSSGRSSEIGRISDSGRESSIDFTRDMERRLADINSILDSLPKIDDDKEINRDSIYGIDQEAVRKEEKREFKLSSDPSANMRASNSADDEKIIDESEAVVEKTKEEVSGLKSRIANLFGDNNSDTQDSELSQMMAELYGSKSDNNSKQM